MWLPALRDFPGLHWSLLQLLLVSEPFCPQFCFLGLTSDRWLDPGGIFHFFFWRCFHSRSTAFHNSSRSFCQQSHSQTTPLAATDEPPPCLTCDVVYFQSWALPFSSLDFSLDSYLLQVLLTCAVIIHLSCWAHQCPPFFLRMNQTVDLTTYGSCSLM